MYTGKIRIVGSSSCTSPAVFPGCSQGKENQPDIKAPNHGAAQDKRKSKQPPCSALSHPQRRIGVPIPGNLYPLVLFEAILFHSRRGVPPDQLASRRTRQVHPQRVTSRVVGPHQR